MNCISWNIRGLNNAGKKRILENRIMSDNLDILLIQETKVELVHPPLLLNSCFKPYNFLANLETSSAGGIMTLWKDSKFDLISSLATHHSITVVLRIIGTNESISITNVYFPHKVILYQIKMLQCISNLLDPINLPFKIIAGDFNMITNFAEKRGGIWKLNKDSEAFLTTIENLNLIDIPTNNGIYTWNNRRGGDRQIASRLDRFLLSEETYLTSSEIEARILPQAGSNNWHISLKIQICNGQKNKRFRFEAFWLDHPDLMEKMKQGWSNPPTRLGNKMYKFHQKLKYIKEEIKKWNRESFDNIITKKNKKKLKHKLELLQQNIIEEGLTKSRK